jgi:hypothetical protein
MLAPMTGDSHIILAVCLDKFVNLSDDTAVHFVNDLVQLMNDPRFSLEFFIVRPRSAHALFCG